MSGQRDLVGAAGWSLLAAVIARGSNLAALVACARLLPQAEFGQVAIIQSTVGMLAPLASLGLAMTSTKFVAEYRDSDPVRAGRLLGLSLTTAVIAGALMTLALILLAPWIASAGFAAPGLSTQLVAASGLLMLGVVEATQLGALAGLDAFSRLAWAGAWSGAVSIPVIAGLAYRYGAPGAIAGLTCALGISCMMNGLALREECRRFGIRPSLRGLASETNILWRFSLPSYVSGLLVAPVAWLANAMLVRGPDGFSEMALFAAADRFRYLLIFLPLAVSRTAVPVLSRMRAAGDGDGYSRTLRWNLGVAVLATGVPVLVCMAVSAPLMALFGETFRAGWVVLAVLAFSAIPTVLNTQLGAALLSDGRAWERTGADAVLAISFVGLAWWAIPQWGAAGLAASFAAAYSLVCLVLGVLLRGSEHARR
jgi:O-antigen/teichoic acid export membrane protein